MRVRKVGRRASEARATSANGIAGRAWDIGVREVGPRHWAVRVDLRFREVTGIVWLVIFFTRVDIGALCSMVGPDDGVGNGLRVPGGDPKTDGIPVEDLV